MITTVYEPGTAGDATARALSPSGVSWAAILAGALAAGVLSLLLFMLGIGLGLSSISVWSGKGADGATIGWGAIAWLAVTQLASAAVGGYLAGRLRTKWQGVHTDEVYFRDTAHGFLAWALATIGMVVLAGTVLGSAISGAGKAAASVASGGAQVIGSAAGAAGSVATGAASAAVGAAASGNAKGEGGDLQYWIGSLLRNGGPSEQQKQQAQNDVQQAARKARSAADDAKEVGVIFAHSLQAGKLSDEDADYVAQLVAQHGGMTSEEARQKTQKAFEQVQQQIDQAKQKAQQLQQEAKQAAEAARKATAYSLLWMFVVLLVGAFVGSLSATFGGRQRDNC